MLSLDYCDIHSMSEVKEFVVLVDDQDNVLGTMEKMDAHKQGCLHRAISVLLFDRDHRMLLQKRASTKYHWPNIWSNAVCSHPRKNETYEAAARRRLPEELGITADLDWQFSFIYKATDQATALHEHELDHVFFGQIEETPSNVNPEEVGAVKWIEREALEHDVASNPDQYSFWFKIILQEIQQRNLWPS